MAHWNFPQDKDLTIEKIIEDGGYYDIDGLWNSIIKIDNKLYRGRVETFVFDGDRVYLRKFKDGRHYAVPGGSYDKFLSHIDQAQAEVKEEAKILCDNVQYTGITYIEEHDIPFKKQEGAVYWSGNYNEVYIADYAGPYTGSVHPLNVDNRFLKYGDFYPIKEILPILNSHHRKIFKDYEEPECGTAIKEQEEVSSQTQEYISAKEPEAIPVDWYNHLQVIYQRYMHTRSEIDRQQILNLGWNPDIEPNEDIVRHYLSNDRNMQSEKPKEIHPTNEAVMLMENRINKLIPQEQSLPDGYNYARKWYNSIMEAWNNYKKDDSIENLESLLELDWNPEIEPSVENINKLLDLQEYRKSQIYYTVCNENMFLDTPNYSNNFDKWLNKKSNILFITGLSGSGKSTAAITIANEDGAIPIHLDNFQCYNRFKENGISNITMDYIEKYLKHNPSAKSIDFSDIRYEQFGPAFLDFFNWLIKELGKDKKNRYVIEGVHILLFVKYSDIKKYPILCMGTSVTKSTIRRWVRDQFTAAEILQYGGNELKLFKQWDDQYTDFKSNIIEGYVNEGLDPISSMFLIFLACFYGYVGYLNIKDRINKKVEENAYHYLVSDKKLTKIPKTGNVKLKDALLYYAYFDLDIKKTEKGTLLYSSKNKSNLNKNVYLYKYNKNKLVLEAEGKFSELCDKYDIDIKPMDESKLKDREKAYNIAISIINKEITKYPDLKKHSIIGESDKENYAYWLSGIDDYIYIMDCDVWDVVKNARSDEGQELADKKIWEPADNIMKVINTKLPKGYKVEYGGDWDNLLLKLDHDIKVK